MGRCVQRTKGRHMCPVPAMEAYRECCHCSTHSSPLFHFKDGRTLTSKSFRSTFLPLVWWSYVATIQPNITPTLVQPSTVAARTGLPTDTIWNLGRVHNNVCSGLVEASLFRTLDAIFTSTLCLDQGWRWLELLWLYW
ncbi:hypothetical protein EMCRGX_G029302 [Ephydatia muelleri]